MNAARTISETTVLSFHFRNQFTRHKYDAEGNALGANEICSCARCRWCSGIVHLI